MMTIFTDYVLFSNPLIWNFSNKNTVNSIWRTSQTNICSRLDQFKHCVMIQSKYFLIIKFIINIELMNSLLISITRMKQWFYSDISKKQRLWKNVITVNSNYMTFYKVLNWNIPLLLTYLSCLSIINQIMFFAIKILLYKISFKKPTIFSALSNRESNVAISFLSCNLHPNDDIASTTTFPMYYKDE